MLRLSQVSRRARRMSFALIAALGLAGVAVACSDSTSNATSGKITVLLTDAPGDVKTAVVTISQIYMQGDPDAEDANGRVILRDTPVTTDLLTLANSTADLVKDVTVPAGSYGQLRFVITGGYIEVVNRLVGRQDKQPLAVRAKASQRNRARERKLLALLKGRCRIGAVIRDE